jgi:hypothetical protein
MSEIQWPQQENPRGKAQANHKIKSTRSSNGEFSRAPGAEDVSSSFGENAEETEVVQKVVSKEGGGESNEGDDEEDESEYEAGSGDDETETEGGEINETSEGGDEEDESKYEDGSGDDESETEGDESNETSEGGDEEDASEYEDGSGDDESETEGGESDDMCEGGEEGSGGGDERYGDENQVRLKRRKTLWRKNDELSPLDPRFKLAMKQSAGLKKFNTFETSVAKQCST